MIRRKEIVSLVLIALIFVMMIAYQQWTDNKHHHNIVLNPVKLDALFSRENISQDEVLDRVRYDIKTDLSWDYRFAPDTNLDTYLLATGGQPLRSVISTTWRTGSTFLGEVINAIPGTYYHYEPLLHYGIRQIRGPPLSNSALTTVKALLHCNYTNLDAYLAYGKIHRELFMHNSRLWSLCEQYPEFCWNVTFLNAVCKEFPFQTMKSVRLRLRLMDQLLNDAKLNVKVVLLVRDPRAVLQSRKHRIWCPGEADCDNPAILCADMVSDYTAAIRLIKQFPDRFLALRYEDVSLEPMEHLPRLLTFLGLDVHPNVFTYLESHTKNNIGGVSSTFRDSKTAPFHWRLNLTFNEVQSIEVNCEEAMSLWGYVKVNNVDHLQTFNPLRNYTIT